MTDDVDVPLAAYLGFPLAGETSALDLAAAHFRAAATGDEPLAHVGLALRAFLLAIARSEHRTPAYDAGRLCELGVRAAMALVRSTDALSLERAISGFQTFQDFASLLALGAPPLTENDGILLDRLDQIALFADELDALRRRAAINARGAPLARFNAIQAALLDDPVGDWAH